MNFNKFTKNKLCLTRLWYNKKEIRKGDRKDYTISIFSPSFPLLGLNIFIFFSIYFCRGEPAIEIRGERATKEDRGEVEGAGRVETDSSTALATEKEEEGDGGKRP